MGLKKVPFSEVVLINQLEESESSDGAPPERASTWSTFQTPSLIGAQGCPVVVAAGDGLFRAFSAFSKSCSSQFPFSLLLPEDSCTSEGFVAVASEVDSGAEDTDSDGTVTEVVVVDSDEDDEGGSS